MEPKLMIHDTDIMQTPKPMRHPQLNTKDIHIKLIQTLAIGSLKQVGNLDEVLQVLES